MSANAAILVVEDEPDIQMLISINLERAGYQTIAAPDAESARRRIAERVPRLVLLDWNLPGMSGVELLRRLRSLPQTRQLPVIMLSARVSVADKVQALNAGCDDYVSKPFSPSELVARVHAVLRRHDPQNAGDIVQLAGLRLDPAQLRVYAADRELSLGPTEFRLLHFLMANCERVHSRTKLLDMVWGINAAVDERTIDSHIRRLRSALKSTGHDVLIRTERGVGYRMSADAPPADARLPHSTEGAA